MTRAILMSIHPKWAKLIYEGKKTIEWRKNTINDYTSGMKVYLYETSPVKAVTGYFVMAGFTGLDAKKGFFDCIDTMNVNNGCVSKKDLIAYQGKSDILVGWCIKRAFKLDNPKTLSDFGLKRPPQSWQYVEEK